MQRISELFLRLVGPIMIVIAFSVFSGMSKEMTKYQDNVSTMLINSDDVYNEGYKKLQEHVFQHDADGGMTVDGSCLMGMLLSNVTVTTEIVDNTDRSMYFRIVLDTRLGTNVYYAVFDTSLLSERLVKSGVYYVGDEVPFIEYLSMTGKYRMQPQHGPSGSLDRIIFTRV